MPINFNRGILLPLAACYFVISINFGIRYTYGLLAVEMMNDMNFSNRDVGLMFSCFLLSFTLTGFLTGHLIDKRGAKTTILTIFPLLGIGSIFLSVTSSAISGVLFSIIAGVGASAGWAPVLIWSQKLYPKKRGLIVGIMESGTKLCPFLIALAIPQIIYRVGWRGVWLLLGAISLSSIILVSAAYEPRAGENEMRKKTYSSYVKAILGNRVTWLIGVSYVLSAFATMLHATFYKAYLSKELMMNVDVSTLLYGLMHLAGIVGSISVPAFSDRIGRKPLIMACNAILVLSLLGFLLSNSTLNVILFTALIGIDLGAKWPLYVTFIKDLYEWEIAGLATALLGLFSGTGSLLAPYIGGLLADLYSTYKISYAIGICAGSIAIALIGITKVKIRAEGMDAAVDRSGIAGR